MLPAGQSISSSPRTRPLPDVESLTAPTQDPRIRQALSLLRQYRAPGLSELAAMLNLSTSRFRHLFKKELGVSPKHYLTTLRLQRARRLLENSYLEVKEVTAAIGVNDVSHFVRNYKAMYHQTPSQTRALAPNASAENPGIATSAKK